MSVTSFKTPLTTVNDTTVGSKAWVNPNNAQTDNATTTTQDTDNSVDLGNYLKCTNYGFTTSDIPSGSTINGIEIVFKRKSESNTGDTLDHSVKIVQGGTISGTDKATATAWDETALREDTYGGATELYGLSWADTDIVGSTTFGAAIASKATGAINKLAEIDVVKIRVYYTEPGGGPTAVPNALMMMGAGA